MPLPFLALRRAGDLALGLRAGDLARPRGFGAGEAARAPPADWRRVATMTDGCERRGDGVCS